MTKLHYKSLIIFQKNENFENLSCNYSYPSNYFCCCWISEETSKENNFFPLHKKEILYWQ